MCCCAKPNVNGEPGYSWDGKNIGVRPVAPPTLADGDVLLFDEPGRCGGIDSHSHHYRLVKNGGYLILRVYHGGGDDHVRVRLYKQQPELFARMDSNDRYWLFNALYSAHSHAMSEARDVERSVWRTAAAEKRIKTRKQPGRNAVKVWIEDPAPVASYASV